MLIERDQFLECMGECMSGVVAGAGHSLFLVGEAGIGKTSLLREFVSRARNQVRILSASCEDFSSPEPLTLVRELCPDQDIGAGTSRFVTFSTALDWLCSEPTLLAIEDIHWADDASMDFLRFVGRRLAEQPVMLVLTSRDDDNESRARLSRVLGDISPDHRTRIDLPRLSANGVRQLALDAGLFGIPIHELTGGNPLYVSELIAAQGATSTSLFDLVLARAARLPDSAQQALGMLSVVPGRPPIEFVEAARLDPDDIQHCVAAGLLVHGSEGLCFRHELSRRAIESSLGALKQRQLHVQALAIMQSLGASAARQLHHAIAAGQAEDIIRLAPSAAEEASSVGAHREAASALRKLLDHEEMLKPVDAARAWRKLGTEVHVLGQIDEAIRCAVRALDIASGINDLALAGELKTFLSRLTYLGGDRDASLEWGRQAVALLEDQQKGPGLALAYSNLAQLAMLTDDPQSADEWGAKAIDLAEKFRRTDIVAHALNSIAAAVQYVDPVRSRAAHDRSIELALDANNDAEVARIYTNRLCARASSLDFEDAMREAALGIAYCVERDLDVWRIYMGGVKAGVELATGDWDAAEYSAEQALADPSAPLLARNPAVQALATLRVRRGTAADDLLEELDRHLQNCREPGRCIPHALLKAERAWIDGAGAKDALAALDQVTQWFPHQGNQYFSGAINFWRRKLDGTGSHGPGKMAEAYRFQAEGDWRRAADIWHSLGAPYERALALLDGDEAAATEAIHLLDIIGATAAAARARLDLAARGMRHISRGPRASTRSNRFGVTKREREVLLRLEEGLTNREIGELLFVSAKTVDHHVSSLISKLGAKSRRDAVALAREKGLL